MYKLFIVIGDKWQKIQLFNYATMLEVMARVRTHELCCGVEPWWYQVWEPRNDIRARNILAGEPDMFLVISR